MKKALSIFLALLLIIPTLNYPAFAEGGGVQVDPATEAVVTEQPQSDPATDQSATDGEPSGDPATSAENPEASGQPEGETAQRVLTIEKVQLIQNDDSLVPEHGYTTSKGNALYVRIDISGSAETTATKGRVSIGTDIDNPDKDRTYTTVKKTRLSGATSFKFTNKQLKNLKAGKEYKIFFQSAKTKTCPPIRRTQIGTLTVWAANQTKEQQAAAASAQEQTTVGSTDAESFKEPDLTPIENINSGLGLDGEEVVGDSLSLEDMLAAADLTTDTTSEPTESTDTKPVEQSETTDTQQVETDALDVSGLNNNLGFNDLLAGMATLVDTTATPDADTANNHSASNSNAESNVVANTSNDDNVGANNDAPPALAPEAQNQDTTNATDLTDFNNNLGLTTPELPTSSEEPTEFGETASDEEPDDAATDGATSDGETAIDETETDDTDDTIIDEAIEPAPLPEGEPALVDENVVAPAFSPMMRSFGLMDTMLMGTSFESKDIRETLTVSAWRANPMKIEKVTDSLVVEFTLSGGIKNKLVGNAWLELLKSTDQTVVGATSAGGTADATGTAVTRTFSPSELANLENDTEYLIYLYSEKDGDYAELATQMGKITTGTLREALTVSLTANIKGGSTSGTWNLADDKDLVVEVSTSTAAVKAYGTIKGKDYQDNDIVIVSDSKLLSATAKTELTFSKADLAKLKPQAWPIVIATEPSDEYLAKNPAITSSFSITIRNDRAIVTIQGDGIRVDENAPEVKFNNTVYATNATATNSSTGKANPFPVKITVWTPSLPSATPPLSHQVIPGYEVEFEIDMPATTTGQKITVPATLFNELFADGMLRALTKDVPDLDADPSGLTTKKIPANYTVYLSSPGNEYFNPVNNQPIAEFKVLSATSAGDAQSFSKVIFPFSMPEAEGLFAYARGSQRSLDLGMSIQAALSKDKLGGSKPVNVTGEVFIVKATPQQTNTWATMIDNGNASSAIAAIRATTASKTGLVYSSSFSEPNNTFMTADALAAKYDGLTLASKPDQWQFVDRILAASTIMKSFPANIVDGKEKSLYLIGVNINPQDDLMRPGFTKTYIGAIYVKDDYKPVPEYNGKTKEIKWNGEKAEDLVLKDYVSFAGGMSGRKAEMSLYAIPEAAAAASWPKGVVSIASLPAGAVKLITGHNAPTIGEIASLTLKASALKKLKTDAKYYVAYKLEATNQTGGTNWRLAYNGAYVMMTRTGKDTSTGGSGGGGGGSSGGGGGGGGGGSVAGDSTGDTSGGGVDGSDSVAKSGTSAADTADASHISFGTYQSFEMDTLEWVLARQPLMGREFLKYLLNQKGSQKVAIPMAYVADMIDPIRVPIAGGGQYLLGYAVFTPEEDEEGETGYLFTVEPEEGVDMDQLKMHLGNDFEDLARQLTDEDYYYPDDFIPISSLKLAQLDPAVTYDPAAVEKLPIDPEVTNVITQWMSQG